MVQGPPGPDLKWTGDQLSEVQHALHRANLTFIVTFAGNASSTEPLWRSFAQQVQAHCANLRIDIATGVLTHLPDTPSTLPWQLLKPGSSRSHHGTRTVQYEAHGNMTPSNFTLATLSAPPLGSTITNFLDVEGLRGERYLLIGEFKHVYVWY